jgi:hypothetical protein
MDKFKGITSRKMINRKTKEMRGKPELGNKFWDGR